MSDFKEIAQNQKSGGIAQDLFRFLKNNGKWWLLPFIVVFLLLGVLIVLSGTGAAPFIYTLF